MAEYRLGDRESEKTALAQAREALQASLSGGSRPGVEFEAQQLVALRTRAPGPIRANGAEAATSSGNTAIRPINVAIDARLPMPGALLTRQYRGRTIEVRVLPHGFDYEGTMHRCGAVSPA